MSIAAKVLFLTAILAHLAPVLFLLVTVVAIALPVILIRSS